MSLKIRGMQKSVNNIMRDAAPEMKDKRTMEKVEKIESYPELEKDHQDYYPPLL